MPRTLAPDEPGDDFDDLPDTHSPQPVHYAEQALLGALLLEPHRLTEAAGIEPDSFSNYAYGALFAAILALPAPDPVQHARDTSWLNAALPAAPQHARG
ncbi:DnaB-like helicase N-terminal domain-containing protein, partial [Streptomyces sp. JV178]|uniref:DnaB-like helicase N-terminal domain-containing protein n=1 Tax=Streptomyces sp. JV178 TaxID=858632 RepID=UPI0027D1F747